MSTPIVNLHGLTGVIEQPIEIGWSPARGYMTTRTFRGPRADIYAAANTFIANRWEIRVVDGPSTNSTLTAVAAVDLNGNDTGVQDSWEIQPNTISEDILAANIIAGLGISAADLLSLKNWMKGGPDPTGLTGNADALFQLMKEGVSHVQVHQPILRHTSTVSANYQVAASLDSVERIISTATLGTAESIPNWIYQSMPNYAQPSDSRFKFGWYKNPPNITVISFSRTQISQEWQFGLWPVLIYGVLL